MDHPLPTLTTLASFKRALIPGAFLQTTHFRFGGPHPKIAAGKNAECLIVKTFSSRHVLDDWIDSFLAFGPAKEWTFEGSIATFHGDDGNIVYQFIDRTTWEALVRSCYPDVAEMLLKSAIAMFNLEETPHG